MPSLKHHLIQKVKSSSSNSLVVAHIGSLSTCGIFYEQLVCIQDICNPTRELNEVRSNVAQE